jgi:hypothetical protein
VVTSSANATAEKSATPAAPIAILLKIFIVISDLSGSWPCANNPKCGRRFRIKTFCARVPTELMPRKFTERLRVLRDQTEALNPAITLTECAVQIKLTMDDTLLPSAMVARLLLFVAPLGAASKSLMKWWAHQGSNLGPAD